MHISTTTVDGPYTDRQSECDGSWCYAEQRDSEIETPSKSYHEKLNRTARLGVAQLDSKELLIEISISYTDHSLSNQYHHADSSGKFEPLLNI